jgi:hypothetical protein
VKDKNGHSPAYMYYEEEAGRRSGQSHDQGRGSPNRREHRKAARLAGPAAVLGGSRVVDEKISFKDPNGKHLSGLFDVSGGMITVTGPNGRTKTAGIEDSMLSPETLARVLLLQLQQEERQDGVSQRRIAANIAKLPELLRATNRRGRLACRICSSAPPYHL